MLKNVNYYQWIMLIKKSAFRIGTIGVGTRGVKVGHIMNKIYIFAASILFVLLGMTISRADDSVLIIKCSNAVDRGVVILDSTPRMNCKDMNLVQLFVGSGLKLGPVPNVDILAKQLEDLAKREQKADPEEVFMHRKETAFSELN